MENEFKFVRLTKANKDKDRLLIAIDGICTVEECKEEECTKVYTMDGFWYAVIDPIEKLDKILGGRRDQDEQKRGKTAFVRKRKMLPPGVDKPQERTSTNEMEERKMENPSDERKEES